MRDLKQPRGPGKSWVFRMMTPPDLVGIPNPSDGNPLPKVIKKGLGTGRNAAPVFEAGEAVLDLVALSIARLIVRDREVAAYPSRTLQRVAGENGQSQAAVSAKRAAH